MSFAYPHRIRILRPRTDGGFGATGYRGAREDREEPIADDLPAAIQLKSEGPKPGAELPGDALHRSIWRILIPLASLEPGKVRVRDVIEDRSGQRYQVTAPYVTAFAHQITAEKLDL